MKKYNEELYACTAKELLDGFEEFGIHSPSFELMATGSCMNDKTRKDEQDDKGIIS